MVQERSREPFSYDGNRTRAISFPLGGIGAGCIGLSGTGRLIDWEIFNRPNKNSYNGFSFFAVRAERAGSVLFARVLHGDAQPPFMGEGFDKFIGFGFGVRRETMAGLPHFSKVRFTGRFPFADIDFLDPASPCGIKLTAFSPFIPMNDRDSSLPAALLTYDVTNRTDEPLDITLAGNLTNPLSPGSANDFVRLGEASGIKLYSTSRRESDADYGDLTLSTTGSAVSYQKYWYRGEWFDNLTVFWREFTTPGPFKDRDYRQLRGGGAITTYNSQDVCLLASHQTVAPGKTARFRFAITWSFPNFVNYWNPGPRAEGEGLPQWKNYYATLFRDSTESARYVWSSYERLYRETSAFQEALFDSTVPSAVLDAVSGNLATMKSPTCLRLTDGTLYGFEGCHAKEGSCEGSCTHVWNYEQAFAFLFPALARSMRDAEYRYNLFPSGKMAFRMLLPPERTLTGTSPHAGPRRAAADGQMGGILKVYREWKVSGDTAWLRAIWPRVKRSLEYAWSPDNEDAWDRDRDGVMEGEQHHTLDVEMYGPNSYISSLYQAGLLAASRIAEALGDADAERYRALSEAGRTWVEENLYDGEYFFQKLDVKDPRFPIDPELGEIKYQIGHGCHIDQIVGQWHAHLLGLGYLFDPLKVKSAMRAIYSHNFRSMRDHENANRIFALNDERGLVICSWPKGGAPKVPVPYADECMNGFEYQAACHMIYEGYVEEAIEVVEAVRERYDGEKRNPWSEIECGSNYVRSLASFALLVALAGFEYDLTCGMIGFSPRIRRRDFRSVWAVGTAWGVFAREGRERIEVRIGGGEITLERFKSDLLAGERVSRVEIRGTPVEFSRERELLRFAPQRLLAGDRLAVFLSDA